MSNEPKKKRNGFESALLVVVGLALVFALVMNRAMTPQESAQVGSQFPAIHAVGWLNGSDQTAAELKGQVIVVDAWAYWCGPCRAATPPLIKLFEKYKDRGVKFIGLTAEGGDTESLGKSREYVESAKIPWPNAYGAVETLLALQVESIPQLWVIDRNNQIAFHEVGWSPEAVPNIEAAIAKALEQPATPVQPATSVQPAAAEKKESASPTDK